MNGRPEQTQEQSRSRVFERSLPWAKSLLAILAGNVLYYLLMPHLPDFWQHKLFKWTRASALISFCASPLTFWYAQYSARGRVPACSLLSISCIIS